MSKTEYKAPDLEARLLPLGQNCLTPSVGMPPEASTLPKGTKDLGLFLRWSSQTSFAISNSFLPHHWHEELELLSLLWPIVPAVRPWVGHLLSLVLSLFICKIEVIISVQPSTQGCMETKTGK